MTEAAVAYYKATGKTEFLDIMKKFADLICRTFGPEEGQNHGYPGHQEIELALIRLYHVTGNKKYLETAKYFIDRRGVGENYFLEEEKKPEYKQIFPEFAGYDPRYSQSHQPVREQKTAEGHAVRAVYMYCAMADLAYEYQDEELMEACKTLWEDMTKRQMYITGSIGASGLLERFTTDYDLPNNSNYSETCASIGLALFGRRMAQITKDASYMDVVERALYNTLLSGIAQDGKSFFYVNPLEVLPEACHKDERKFHVKDVRQKWFGCACCPPNLARTLSSVSSYAFTENDDTLFVHLYIGSDVKKKVNGQEVAVHIDSAFPWDGKVTVSVDGANVPLTLALRIPGWANSYTVSADSSEYTIKDGYLYITRTWKKGETLTLDFPMEIQVWNADPRVREDIGKAAVTRGPVTYCLEEKDNGADLHLLTLDWNAPASVKDSVVAGEPVKEIVMHGYREELPAPKAGTLYRPIQKAEKKPAELHFIPYYTWANRGENEMSVWVRV